MSFLYKNNSNELIYFTSDRVNIYTFIRRVVESNPKLKQVVVNSNTINVNGKDCYFVHSGRLLKICSMIYPEPEDIEFHLKLSFEDQNLLKDMGYIRKVKLPEEYNRLIEEETKDTRPILSLQVESLLIKKTKLSQNHIVAPILPQSDLCYDKNFIEIYIERLKPYSRNLYLGGNYTFNLFRNHNEDVKNDNNTTYIEMFIVDLHHKNLPSLLSSLCKALYPVKVLDDYESIYFHLNDNMVVILKKLLFANLDELLYHFKVDLDAIVIPLDTSDIYRYYSIPRFIYAYTNNTCTVNIDWADTNYCKRIARYYQNGVHIYVPHLDLFKRGCVLDYRLNDTLGQHLFFNLGVNWDTLFLNYNTKVIPFESSLSYWIEYTNRVEFKRYVEAEVKEDKDHISWYPRYTNKGGRITSDQIAINHLFNVNDGLYAKNIVCRRNINLSKVLLSTEEKDALKEQWLKTIKSISEKCKSLYLSGTTAIAYDERWDNYYNINLIFIGDGKNSLCKFYSEFIRLLIVLDMDEFNSYRRQLRDTKGNIYSYEIIGSLDRPCKIILTKEEYTGIRSKIILEYSKFKGYNDYFKVKGNYALYSLQYDRLYVYNVVQHRKKVQNLVHCGSEGYSNLNMILEEHGYGTVLPNLLYEQKLSGSNNIISYYLDEKIGEFIRHVDLFKYETLQMSTIEAIDDEEESNEDEIKKTLGNLLEIFE